MHFETERLLLRPRTLADLDDCYDMDRQPGVLDYVRGPWHDPGAHRDFIRQRTTQAYGARLGYWTLALRQAPQRFIGWVLLIPEDGVGPEIEIGWRLRPEYWGNGLATEAARPLLDHAFSRLRLERVIADIDPANKGSTRVAVKVGMHPAGRVEAGYERFIVRRDQYPA